MEKSKTMVNRHIVAAAMVAVLCFSSHARGQWQEWTDASETQNWNDPGNWTGNQVPGPQTDGVTVQRIPGPTISDMDAVVKSFVQIGVDNDGELTIGEGRSLDVKIAVAIGCTDKAGGTLIMQKGSALKADQLYIGNHGKAHLTLDGGRIDCTHFVVARSGYLGPVSTVLLKSGAVYCFSFVMGRDSIIPPEVDIREGKIVQSRNEIQRFKDWVHSKWIVGYGGKGEVVIAFDTADHPNCTVVTAVKPVGK